ncbi:MAG: type II toxin-antitoxin system PemK/MazF family toxin [Candidatus Dormibacteria bacterium]
MLRGELRFVDFEPVRGSEANRRRPAVIVSNDGANDAASRVGRGVITVLPVTSNVRGVLPFQVLIPRGTAGLDRASKVQAEQVRSVAVERVGGALGQLPAALMFDIDEALRLHLAL